MPGPLRRSVAPGSVDSRVVRDPLRPPRGARPSVGAARVRVSPLCRPSSVAGVPRAPRAVSSAPRLAFCWSPARPGRQMLGWLRLGRDVVPSTRDVPRRGRNENPIEGFARQRSVRGSSRAKRSESESFAWLEREETPRGSSSWERHSTGKERQTSSATRPSHGSCAPATRA